MEGSASPDGNASDAFQRFATAGLELNGLEADEIQLGVISLVDSIYRPHIDALMDADLDDVERESRLDPSQPPETP
jgi:hypothetical protein